MGSVSPVVPVEVVEMLDRLDVDRLKLTRAVRERSAAAFSVSPDRAHERVAEVVSRLRVSGECCRLEDGSLELVGDGGRVVVSKELDTVLFFKAPTGSERRDASLEGRTGVVSPPAAGGSSRRSGETSVSPGKSSGRSPSEPGARSSRAQRVSAAPLGSLPELAAFLDDDRIDALEVPPALLAKYAEQLRWPQSEVAALWRDVVAAALDAVDDALEEGRALPSGVYVDVDGAHALTAEGWRVVLSPDGCRVQSVTRLSRNRRR